MPFTDDRATPSPRSRAASWSIVVDDADRENEGDLIMAAEKVTPEAMAFMIRHTSGVICMPLEGERLDELQLPLMVADNTEAQRTAFTVSVDARHGTTTGISAADRATTVHALLDPRPRPEDLARPGHIFPLRYREGGVLKRAGHTEAAVDLARLAGLAPGGRARRGRQRRRHDGAPARPRARSRPSTASQLISIADLIRYRRHREKLVRRVSEARIPTRHGDFTAYVFESLLDGAEHMAFVRGEVAGQDERARARALRVPHRRRVRLAALRLRRCSSTSRWSRSPSEGAGRRRLPARPRGPRDRPRPQAARLHAAGPGPRHRRGQRGARLPGRLARVRHRLADPRRPRHHDDAAHDEQSRRSTAGSRATVSRSSSGSRCTRCPTTRTSRYLRTKQEKLGPPPRHRGRRPRRQLTRTQRSWASTPRVRRATLDAAGMRIARRRRAASTSTSPSRCSTARSTTFARRSALDDVPRVLGARRVRDPAGRASAWRRRARATRWSASAR